MAHARRDVFDYVQHREQRSTDLKATHTRVGDARRGEAEAFVRDIFAHHYGATVNSFAPNLMLLEADGQVIAATGWRGAGSESLFLERYLDMPIEQAMATLADQPVERSRIAEVGNLAAEKP
ncbi:MAG: thermostable hemolysin, partial [Azospira sp.]|nr:thermostable hemolysin [Azospira sp.]